MILTKDERKQVYQDWLNSETLTDEDGLIQLAETALLEKLRAGVELPEAAGWMDKNGDVFSKKEAVGFNTSTMKPLYTRDQLLAYGAAQRLAASERGTCTWTEQDDKDMPCTYTSSCGEMWSFIEGGVKENRVTYCHHCGGKVVLAASPQEQT